MFSSCFWPANDQQGTERHHFGSTVEACVWTYTVDCRLWMLSAPGLSGIIFDRHTRRNSSIKPAPERVNWKTYFSPLSRVIRPQNCTTRPDLWPRMCMNARHRLLLVDIVRLSLSLACVCDWSLMEQPQKNKKEKRVRSKLYHALCSRSACREHVYEVTRWVAGFGQSRPKASFWHAFLPRDAYSSNKKRLFDHRWSSNFAS